MFHGLRQRFELFRGFALMNEIATLQLQDDFVNRIEEVGHSAGERIFNQRDRLNIGRLASIDRQHRPGRLEARVRGTQRQIVLEDANEFAEV